MKYYFTQIAILEADLSYNNNNNNNSVYNDADNVVLTEDDSHHIYTKGDNGGRPNFET